MGIGPALLTTVVLLVGAIYVVHKFVAEPDVMHHERWFLPSVLLWLALAPTLRLLVEPSDEPAREAAFVVAIPWSLLVLTIAAFRYCVRRRREPLPRVGRWEASTSKFRRRLRPDR